MSRSPGVAPLRGPASGGSPVEAAPVTPGEPPPLVKELKRRRVTEPLGLSVRSLVITDITPGGPADRAGLKPGWRVLEINQQRVRSQGAYTRACLSAPQSFYIAVDPAPPSPGSGDRAVSRQRSNRDQPPERAADEPPPRHQREIFSGGSTPEVSPPPTPPDAGLDFGRPAAPSPGLDRGLDPAAAARCDLRVRPGGVGFDAVAPSRVPPGAQRGGPASRRPAQREPPPQREPADPRRAHWDAAQRTPSPRVQPPPREPQQLPQPHRPLKVGERAQHRARSAQIPLPQAPDPGGSGIWKRGRLLGRGAFGTVFMGRMTDTGQVVAVKEIEIQAEADPSKLAVLQREVKLMRELKHEHLVRYYQCSKGETLAAVPCFWIFMEYLPEGTLGSLVRHMRRGMGDGEAASYIWQITCGVEYLHAKGIVHRDLKGDNVLLAAGGKLAKVSDFGTAKQLSTEAHSGNKGTAARTVTGTPLWMAPEVFNSGAGGYCCLCDVWSIGIVACEVLNRGRPPWPKYDSVWAAVWAIGGWTEKDGLPPETPRGLSPAAHAFICATLRADARKRPTCRELLQLDWLRQADPSPPPRSASPPLPPPPQQGAGAGLRWAACAEAADEDRDRVEADQALACDALRTSGLLWELDGLSRRRHRRDQGRAKAKRELLLASQASLARSMQWEREEAQAEGKRLEELQVAEIKERSEELAAAQRERDAAAAALASCRREVAAVGRRARVAHQKLEDLLGKLRVVARARPLDPGQEGALDFPEGEGRLLSVRQIGGSAGVSFVFDRAFGGEATQEHIWEEGPADLCRSALSGGNVCILAYGQTGGGKTHTIVGSDGSPGLAPRAVSELFRAPAPSPGVTRRIRASCVELGADGFVDLLAPSARKRLSLRRGSAGLAEVAGCVEVACPDERALSAAFAKGCGGRAVRGTLMNERSSRTHLLFTITIEHLEGGKDPQVGRLCLVDLAGSERPARSGVTDEGLREAVAINRSLAALGNCIESLAQGRGFVPWRDHDLTQYLQRFLGGAARSLLVACVSQDPSSVRETKSTLAFAQRAKLVQLAAPQQLAARRAAIAEQERLVAAVRGELDRAEDAVVDAEVRFESCEEKAKEVREDLAELQQKRKQGAAKKALLREL